MGHLRQINPLTRLSLGIFALGTLVILAASLMLTNGTFIYSMDDPYIHLAVSEEIIRGNYGINIRERSSPSSSIIYAYLMAPFVWIGAGNYAQYILNLVFQAVALIVISNIVYNYISKNIRRHHTLWYCLFASALVLALNSLALPMTGMEHSLHVMISVLLVYGLYRAEKDRTASLWMVALITLNVLTRFEGLALSLACIGGLFILKQRRMALVALIVLITSLLAYGIYMSSMGLPLVPSSVMIKSGVTSSIYENRLMETGLRLYLNVFQNMTKVLNPVMLLMTGFMVWCCKRKEFPFRITVLTVCLSIVGHVVLGSDGSMYRYQIYLIAICIMALVLCFEAVKIEQEPMKNVRILLLLIGIFAVSFLKATIVTPKGSQNIHDQQYQMHIFATQYFREPVAVNDLGWVSYRNDIHVLDIYGLGSEQARKFNQEDGIIASNMATLVQDNKITYAMVYDEVYGEAIPDGWCRIAELHTIMVTSSEAMVAFYLIDRSKEAQMREAMARFAPTLPREASLVTQPCK